jgi:hypothetical protein
METIEQRLAKLKTLTAGDAQCNDCLTSQAPEMCSIEECKRCIAATPAFTALVQGLMDHRNKPTSNAKVSGVPPQD